MPERDVSDNPYEPLDQRSDGSVQYEFEGTVSFSDLIRANKSSRRVMIVMLPLGLFALYRAWESFRFGAAETGGVLTVAGFASWFIWWRSWRVPHRYAKGYPHIFGRIRGVLATDFVEIETEHAKHRYEIDGFQINGVRDEFISIKVGLDWLLMPHLFEDYEGARNLALEIQRSSAPTVLGDPSLTEPPTGALANPPATDAITFQGELIASDYSVPEVAKALQSGRWFLFRRTLLAVIAVGVVVTTIHSRLAMVAVLFLVANWWYQKVYKRFTARLEGARATRDTPDLVVSNIRGWLSEEIVFLQSAIGYTCYQLTGFSRAVWKNDDTIILFSPGNMMLCVVSRRLFENDQDWNRAGEIVERNVPRCESISEADR